MERLGAPSDNQVRDGDGPAQRPWRDGVDRDGTTGRAMLDEPSDRPEQPRAPGVVDAWFFLGW